MNQQDDGYENWLQSGSENVFWDDVEYDVKQGAHGVGKEVLSDFRSGRDF